MKQLAQVLDDAFCASVSVDKKPDPHCCHLWVDIKGERFYFHLNAKVLHTKLTDNGWVQVGDAKPSRA